MNEHAPPSDNAPRPPSGPLSERRSTGGTPSREPTALGPLRLRSPLLIGLVAGLLVIVILGAVLVALLPGQDATGRPVAAPTPDGQSSAPASPTIGSTAAQGVGTIPGVVALPSPARDHTSDPISYPEVPPMGGKHWKDWINCGVYDRPVQAEQAVHSLEHGAVWITYRPDLPVQQVQMLRALTRASSYRLLSPVPGLPSPIVASAWGYQLPLEQAGDSRLSAFIGQHERDPKGPEPGAPCSGSGGTPLP